MTGRMQPRRPALSPDAVGAVRAHVVLLLLPLAPSPRLLTRHVSRHRCRMAYTGYAGPPGSTAAHACRPPTHQCPQERGKTAAAISATTACSEGGGGGGAKRIVRPPASSPPPAQPRRAVCAHRAVCGMRVWRARRRARAHPTAVRSCFDGGARSAAPLQLLSGLKAPPALPLLLLLLRPLRRGAPVAHDFRGRALSIGVRARPAAHSRALREEGEAARWRKRLPPSRETRAEADGDVMRSTTTQLCSMTMCHEMNHVIARMTAGLFTLAVAVAALVSSASAMILAVDAGSEFMKVCVGRL
jgi:hypothetical protein